VDDPQLLLPSSLVGERSGVLPSPLRGEGVRARPGELMNTNIACHVTGPWQIAGVVLPDRLDARGDVWSIAKRPDLRARAQRDAPLIHGQAHRLVESTDQQR